MEFPRETHFPSRTLFECGAALKLEQESQEYNGPGLIVHGKSLEKSGKLKEITAKFPPAAKLSFVCRGGGEPSLDEVSDAVKEARKAGAKWVAGIGGGSVLDLAKAAAGLFNAKEAPAYYQQGGALKEPGIPFIAVPTTAGTGSEATINSVITDTDKKVKQSIRDKSFLAAKVILDPDLLKSAPRDIIAHSGMDALVQAYEAYVSKHATPFTDMLALKALALINRHILAAFQKPDKENLTAMLAGSYYAGVALANARLGVIHGIAHPLGVIYQKPHGLVCAVCLPASIKLNKTAMGQKYKSLCKEVGLDFLERSEALIGLLAIRSPFKGREVIDKGRIIEETVKSGSTAANPKQITAEDVEFLLKELF